MPLLKANNPFDAALAMSSTSQISPSPTRASVKSHGSQSARLSTNGRASNGAKTVSFAGGAKAGTAEEVQLSVGAIKEI